MYVECTRPWCPQVVFTVTELFKQNI